MQVRPPWKVVASGPWKPESGWSVDASAGSSANTNKKWPAFATVRGAAARPASEGNPENTSVLPAIPVAARCALMGTRTWPLSESDKPGMLATTDLLTSKPVDLAAVYLLVGGFGEATTVDSMVGAGTTEPADSMVDAVPVPVVLSATKQFREVEQG
jgi:hypothetical protein